MEKFVDYFKGDISDKPTLTELKYISGGDMMGITTKQGADGFWKYGKKPRLIKSE